MHDFFLIDGLGVVDDVLLHRGLDMDVLVGRRCGVGVLFVDDVLLVSGNDPSHMFVTIDRFIG
jgi:hypothetical protein